MSFVADHRAQGATVSRAPDGRLFVSLELSRSTWLVTSLSPGGDRMSKHTVAGGDGGVDFPPGSGGVRSERHAAARMAMPSMPARASAGVR